MNIKSVSIEKRVINYIAFIFGTLHHEKGKRNILETGVGEKIYMASSKIHNYKTYRATWQAVDWDLLVEADYYCQIIEDKGFLLIPTQVLREMSKHTCSDQRRFFVSVRFNEGMELQTRRGLNNISLKYYYHHINLDSYEEIMAA